MTIASQGHQGRDPKAPRPLGTYAHVPRRTPHGAPLEIHTAAALQRARRQGLLSRLPGPRLGPGPRHGRARHALRRRLALPALLARQLRGQHDRRVSSGLGLGARQKKRTPPRPTQTEKRKQNAENALRLSLNDDRMFCCCRCTRGLPQTPRSVCAPPIRASGSCADGQSAYPGKMPVWKAGLQGGCGPARMACVCLCAGRGASPSTRFWRSTCRCLGDKV